MTARILRRIVYSLLIRELKAMAVTGTTMAYIRRLKISPIAFHDDLLKDGFSLGYKDGEMVLITWI